MKGIDVFVTLNVFLFLKREPRALFVSALCFDVN